MSKEKREDLARQLKEKVINDARIKVITMTDEFGEPCKYLIPNLPPFTYEEKRIITQGKFYHFAQDGDRYYYAAQRFIEWTFENDFMLQAVEDFIRGVEDHYFYGEKTYFDFEYLTCQEIAQRFIQDEEEKESYFEYCKDWDGEKKIETVKDLLVQYRIYNFSRPIDYYADWLNENDFKLTTFEDLVEKLNDKRDEDYGLGVVLAGYSDNDFMRLAKDLITDGKERKSYLEYVQEQFDEC